MKNLLKYRQNKWSEFGKDFFAKMRKNTCILIGFNTYKMRKKYARIFKHWILQPTKNEQNTKQRKNKKWIKYIRD